MKRTIFKTITALTIVAAMSTGCGSSATPSASASAPAPSSSAASASVAPSSAAASVSAAASQIATDAASAAASAKPASGKKLKVGYCVNLLSHEWYQNICKGAKIRAEELGIDLVIADANMDSNTQISSCENLLAENVDVLVITPVDSKLLGNIIDEANKKGVPVITESNVVEGAKTFVGIDNETSGKMDGKWMGEYAKANKITPKILIVGLPNFPDCAMRVKGFKEGLDETGVKYTVAQEVNGQGVKDKANQVATDALIAHQDVNVIFGINDDSTTGALQAYRGAGMDESKLTAVSFGFEGAVGQNELLSGGAYKAALAMFPNYVGVALIDAAQKAANGETLPAHYQTPTVVMTKDNFPKFYKKSGTGYEMDFDAIRTIPVNNN